MRIRIRLSNQLHKEMYERLKQAHKSAQLRLMRRILVILHIAAGKSIAEVVEMMGVSEQTVRNYIHAFILKGTASLAYKRPSGRPPKLTKTQRKELADLITAGPQAAGYACGGWTALLIQDLILRRFGVEYHPHYICELLDTLGFSFQKARFVSDHLQEAARIEWMEQTWPQILRLARTTQALILFGDEASFAQWGSLSYTWAPKGQQPTVKTSGKRKAYKVFGLIEYFSGRLFYQGHTGRFNSDSYTAFLTHVLAQTTQPLILIQDGARYHTSRITKQFFVDHAERLTVFQLPSYSPDFNPIEFLWKKVKKLATHLRYFPDFNQLVQSVDEKLAILAAMPSEITALMGRYCASLGTITA